MLKVKLSQQEERMVTQQSFGMTNFLFTEGNKRFFGQTPSLMAGAKAEEIKTVNFIFDVCALKIWNSLLLF